MDRKKSTFERKLQQKKQKDQIKQTKHTKIRNPKNNMSNIPRKWGRGSGWGGGDERGRQRGLTGPLRAQSRASSIVRTLPQCSSATRQRVGRTDRTPSETLLWGGGCKTQWKGQARDFATSPPDNFPQPVTTDNYNIQYI